MERGGGTEKAVGGKKKTKERTVLQRLDKRTGYQGGKKMISCINNSGGMKENRD